MPVIAPTISYQVWNNLLLKHFFSADKGNDEVFVTVNRNLLDTLGKESHGIDNGSEDFIRAVVFWVGPRRNVCERAEDIRSAFDGGLTEESPTFFGVICFFVLAWGEDADLSAANYYGRLNSLLEHGGAAESRIGTPQFKSTVALWESLGRWSIRDRVSADWGGRFVVRKFGMDYIGYPLAQAMLTANERRRLERLFDEFQSEYDADQISPSDMCRMLALRGEQLISRRAWIIFQKPDMRDAFIGMSCSLYSDWCNRRVDEDAGTEVTFARVGLRLVLRYSRAGNVSLAARLHFPNGDCPDDGCEASVRTAEGQFHGDRRHLPRQSACWSGLFHPIDFRQLDQCARIVVYFGGGQEKNLPITGLRQGAIYFEHDVIRGEWAQLTNGNTGVPCRLLLKGDPVGQAVEDRNQDVLNNCRKVSDDWQLWESPNGLVEVSGIGNPEEPPSLRLQGGLKLASRGDRYSEHGPPRIYLQGTNLDEYELRVIATSLAVQMVYQEPQLKSGHLYPIPTEALEPDQSYEVQLIRAANEEPETRKRFSLESSSTLQSNEDLQEDHWPDLPESQPQFLFSIDSFSLWLDSGRHLGGELLITKDDLPTQCLSTHWVDGMKITLVSLIDANSRDLVRHAEGHWEIPVGTQSGKYHIRAFWLGMQIGKPVPFKVGELPRCQLRVEKADRISSGGADGIVVFAVPPDTTPRLVIDCSQRVLARFYSDEEVVFSHTGTSIICDLKPDWFKAPRKIRVRCFLRETELSDFEVRFENYPNVTVLATGGEFWPGTQIYRSNRRPALHVATGGLGLAALAVFVGSHECPHSEEHFRVPSSASGGTFPVRVKWNNLVVAHAGCTHISIEAGPEYLIELQGGRRKPGGGYYQNTLPRVTLGGLTQFPPPQELSAVLDSEKACELKADGRIEVGCLASGTHQLQLTWRGIPVGTEVYLDVEPPPKTTLTPIGGQLIAPNTYLASDLPRLLLKYPSAEFVVLCQGQKLESLECHLFDLDGISPKGGHVKIEYWEGTVMVTSCRINVIDESWQSVGCLGGQLATANSEHQWHACWFTKKNGRERTMILGPGCPKTDCSICEHTTGAPGTGHVDWRRIVKASNSIPSNPTQWKKFVAYTGRSKP